MPCIYTVERPTTTVPSTRAFSRKGKQLRWLQRKVHIYTYVVVGGNGREGATIFSGWLTTPTGNGRAKGGSKTVSLA